MRTNYGHFAWTLLALGVLFLAVYTGASTGDFRPLSKLKAVDRLSLVGNSGGPQGGSPARPMFVQPEGNTQNLYVQPPSQPGFTVIHVSQPGRPRVVRHAPLHSVTVMGSGYVITETSGRSGTVDPQSGGTIEGGK